MSLPPGTDDHPLLPLRRAVTLMLWGIAASSVFQLASTVFVRVLTSLPDQQRSSLRWVSSLINALAAIAAALLCFGWLRFNAFTIPDGWPSLYEVEHRGRGYAAISAAVGACILGAGLFYVACVTRIRRHIDDEITNHTNDIA